MRIVAISDIHMKHGQISLPDGDLLLIAGDMLNSGSFTELQMFTSWLQSRPHKHKIVVAGNHDWAFEDYPEEARKLIEDTGATYLQSQEAIVDTVKFYGSPYTPEFCNWAFNVPRSPLLKQHWDKIPQDTDVLITHGPPKGILDLVTSRGSSNKGLNVGCEDLVKAVKTIKPKIHVFGHIHEGFGNLNAGVTKFYNVAICDARYRPVNPATVIDL